MPLCLRVRLLFVQGPRSAQFPLEWVGLVQHCHNNLYYYESQKKYYNFNMKPVSMFGSKFIDMFQKKKQSLLQGACLSRPPLTARLPGWFESNQTAPSPTSQLGSQCCVVSSTHEKLFKCKTKKKKKKINVGVKLQFAH